MTVCISALAEEVRAIVCTADPALTYGLTIQWESDSSKMFSLRKGGMIIMFAGEEELISRILGKVIAKEEELGKDVSTTRRILESECQEAVQELVEARFVTPRLLTREQYIKAISGTDINAAMQAVATEINMYSPEAELIMSGFDEKGAAFTLAVDPLGVVTNMTIMGFHSIGTGWEKSVSKLLFSDFSRKDPLHTVIYDVFDAKAFAEMAAGVGADWETRIITGHESGTLVPYKIDSLVERGWVEHELHPFAIKGLDKDEDRQETGKVGCARTLHRSFLHKPMGIKRRRRKYKEQRRGES